MDTTIKIDKLKQLAQFLSKWNIYQKVRFPIVTHGILILAFSFSAVSYALLSNGENEFISISVFLPGFVIVLTIFLLLRIADEFKDADDDKKYRPELPVPSGLISLSELKFLAISIILFQIVIQLLFIPHMFWLYIMVMLYLALMTKEFFVEQWLRKNQFWYVTSHMLIIPLVDLYASALYWNQTGISAPTTLIFFFIVSFFNGIVLEIGRKIKAPEQEREGVQTYSFLLGADRATQLWLFTLMITCVCAVLAIYYSTAQISSIVILLLFWFIISIVGLRFLKRKTIAGSKTIELASGVWALSMYILLGGFPMLYNFINKLI